MTSQESIDELRKFQKQIIHGSNIFGDIADVIERNRALLQLSVETLKMQHSTSLESGATKESADKSRKSYLLFRSTLALLERELL